MNFKKQSKNIKNILLGIRNKMLKKLCQETPFGSIEVKVPQSYQNHVNFSSNYVYPGSIRCPEILPDFYGNKRMNLAPFLNH